MKTWQIVGQAWKQASANLPIVGLIFGIQLVLGLLALPFAGQTENLAGPSMVLAILLGLVNFLIWPLIQGGTLAFANGQTAGQTQGSPISRFLAGGKQLYLRMLGFGLLWAGLCLVLVIIGVLLFVLAAMPAAQAPALSVILVLIVSVPVALGFYGLILLTAVSPLAIVVEKLGVIPSLRRGFKVGRPALGKLLLVSLCLSLTLMPGVLLVMIPAFMQAGGGAMGTAGQVLGLMFQSVLNALSMLLFSLAFVHIYRQLIAVTPTATAR